MCVERELYWKGWNWVLRGCHESTAYTEWMLCSPECAIISGSCWGPFVRKLDKICSEMWLYFSTYPWILDQMNVALANAFEWEILYKNPSSVTLKSVSFCLFFWGPRSRAGRYWNKFTLRFFFSIYIAIWTWFHQMTWIDLFGNSSLFFRMIGMTS